MKKLNAELSKFYQAKFKTQPQMCYYNCVANIAKFDDVDIIYVEGQLIHSDGSSFHAWIELGNDIIELTVPNSDIWMIKAYLPFIRYTIEDVLFYAKKVKLPPLYVATEDLEKRYDEQMEIRQQEYLDSL